MRWMVKDPLTSPTGQIAGPSHEASPRAADPPELPVEFADGAIQVLPETATGPALRTGMAVTSLAIMAFAAVLAVILRRAEVLAVAIPFFASFCLTALEFQRNTTTVWGSVARLRQVEGDTIEIAVELTSTHNVAVCEVELTTPDAMTPLHSLRVVTGLTGGTVQSIRFPVQLAMWGLIDLNDLMLSIRTSDRLGMFSQRMLIRGIGHLKVALHDEHLRSLIAPDRFRQLVGGHTSVDRGDGIELADVREYRAGDPQQWINWRLTSRQREPWVTLRHPDRSTTIVLVADLAGNEPVLQRATARATAAIARAHLGVFDKVGLYVAGETNLWVEPQLGPRQMLAISDALLAEGSADHRRVETQAATRIIPIEAITLVVSPLLDAGIDRVVGGLRSQGRSVVVIEPRRTFKPGPELRSRERADLELAHRLSRIEVQLRRRHLTQRGVPVIGWDIDESLEAVIREIVRMRRRRGPKR